MSQFDLIDEDQLADLACPVCHLPFIEPVELQPCRHVVCKEHCFQPDGSKIEKCFTCQKAVTKFADPNKIIIMMSAVAKLQCKKCSANVLNANRKAHPDRCGKVKPLSETSDGAAADDDAVDDETLSPSKQTAALQKALALASSPSSASPSSHHHQGPGPILPIQQDFASSSTSSIYTPQPSRYPGYQNQNQKQQQQQHQHQQKPRERLFVAKPQSSGPWSQYGLSQEEYDHIMCVFLTFDVSGSGTLSRNELGTLSRFLNYAHSKEDIDNMFKEMDRNNTGQLDQHSFCTWLSKNRPDPQKLYNMSLEEYHEALYLFHQYDNGSRGQLSQEEFREWAQKLQFARNNNDADMLFSQIDTKQAGHLDLNTVLGYIGQVRYIQQHGAGLQPGTGIFTSAPNPMARMAWQQ